GARRCHPSALRRGRAARKGIKYSTPVVMPPGIFLPCGGAASVLYLLHLRKGAIIMSVLAQLAVIFLVCLISEGICALLPIAFPAAVMAMVLLLLLLFGRAFKPEQLRESSDFLLDHMAFFFVPGCVSLIKY